MWGKNRALATIITIVVVFISTTIFFHSDFLETRRDYYLIDKQYMTAVTPNFNIEKVVQEIIGEISKTAEIYDWNFDEESFVNDMSKNTVSYGEQSNIKEQVKSHIDIIYKQYELTILKDGSKFYFISESEAEKFKEQLDVEVTISCENVEDLSKISSEETLKNKISQIEKEKTEEKKKREQVTSRGGTVLKRSGTGILPVRNYVYISSYYRSASRPNHTGVDFAASKGTEILAYKSGIVTRASWYSGYGMCIEISHPSGEKTRYAHCSSYNVSVGQNVTQGQVIGYVGSTGNSTGPHLHFEIMIKGKFVNPLNYI